MILSGLFLLAAAVFAVQAWRFDRALRTLLAPRIARRWSSDRTPLASPGDAMWANGLAALPAHWQPHLHSERGAAIANRLYLCIAFASVFGMLGFLLLAELL